MGLEESYQKSIASLALKNIPTDASYEPGPNMGQADFLEDLDRARFRREFETPEEKVMGQLGNLPGPQEAIAGMTKLGAASKVARQLLPYVEKASGDVLARLGGIWRSALEIPRREYGRVYDIDVLNEIPRQTNKSTGELMAPPRARTLFPKHTPEGWKPSVQVSASEGWWQSLWHEIAAHTRQIVPEFRGSKDFKVGKYDLSEADVADLLWRIRHKMHENKVWTPRFDPTEVHARKIPERLPGLKPGPAYDFNYDMTLIETLNQAKRDWPKFFDESLGELVSEYPSKVWPITPD